MKSIKFLSVMALFFIIAMSPPVFLYPEKGEQPQSLSDSTFYYIDLLGRGGLDIQEVRGEMLNLKYEDRYFKNPEFTAELYDWQQNLLQSKTFQKRFGENLYNIPLDSFFGGWEPGKIYSLVTRNDTGKKYTAYIRIPEEGEREIPQVEIQVDPIAMDCGSPEESLIQFSGIISGGKGPYRISWTVLDESLSHSLYQPRDEKVPVYGFTPVIQVDSPPNYLVSLQVVDACGTETEKRVLITCEEQIEKANTIFVEKHKQLPKAGKQ